MDDNGFPAPNNSRKGLSAAEFQRNLYNWFEKRGLLDDLRTQLRHQMVTALRNTSLGPGTSKHSNVTVSPKIQSINLLIAEFLLHHEHHYTLSVFTSEVPLLRTLPEFTKSGTQICEKSNPIESAPRFYQRDVRDILESFGLHVESEIGKRIFTQYQDSTEGIALLTCILQNVSDNRFNNPGRTVAPSASEVPSQNSPSSTTLKDTTNSEKEVRAIKKLKEMYKAEMKEIVYQSQMKSQHIKQLQEEIRRFQETEVERVRKEEEAKFQKELLEREARIQAELNLHDEAIARKVEDAEKKIAKQRQTLENEIKMKQQKLSEHATQLQDQHLDLAHKLHRVEEREEQLKREERRIEEVKQRDSLQLAERTSVLDVRQQQLQQEFQRLNAERETMNYVQLELEDSRRQLMEARQSLAHSQSEVTFLRNIQQQCNHLRYELDATRFKLDNLAELQMHNPSEVLIPNTQRRQVEMIDKGLQVVLSQRTVTAETSTSITPPPLPPPPQPSESEKISTNDETQDLEQIQSQQKLQQQQFEHLTDVLRRVQRENEELRGHTQQQRLRIDELTSHATELANQLEDAHTAITLLSNRTAQEPVPGPSEPRMLQPIYLSPGSLPPLIAPPPPPPPPPPLPPQGPRHATQSRQMGAGEVLNYVTPPPPTQPPPISFGSSSSHSNTSHRREWRKKPPRRLMVYSNSNSSDETSPTEEILQEARRRLRKLEEESEAVDRSYQNFRRRHENLGVTTSLLFHPVLPPPPPPPPPIQYGSTLGYGCYTSSRPYYSSATGTSHTPIIYSNFNYGNSPSSIHLSSSLFNPLISNTTSRLFPPLYQSSFAGGSGSQYAFPPRSQMSGTLGNISSAMSGRITTHSRNQDLNNVISSQNRFVTEPLETRFTLPSQPSLSDEHPSNRILQAKDKTASSRKRMERSNSISQINMLDAYNFAASEPYNHQHVPKTVTFASPLKTTMVYTTPQVSSSIGNSSKQSENNGALTIASYTSDRPITSAVQNLSRVENEGENSNKEPNIPDRTPDVNGHETTEIERFSENGSQDHGLESHLTQRLSTDNIWQVQHKSSSNFSPTLEPEIPIKDSKSVDKDVVGPTNEIGSMDSSSVQRLFPISDTSKSHTTFSDEPHPSGSFALSETTEGGSNDVDIHPVFPVCSVSGNTFSSSIKDPSFESSSTDREVLIQPTTESYGPHEHIDIMPAHEEEILSEKSVSGTQTQITVRNKEGEVSISNTASADKGSKHTILSISQDLLKETMNVEEIHECSDHSFKEVENIENFPFPENGVMDRIAGSATSILDTPEVSQEKQADVNENESTENVQLVSDIRNVFNPPNIENKVFTHSKAEKSKSEISTEEESEGLISLGESNKKEDSSQDDFW